MRCGRIHADSFRGRFGRPLSICSATQDVHTLTLALSGLVNVTSSDNAKAAIAASGALPLLQGLIEHPNPEVGVLAASAVANLCNRNPDIADQCLALGACS